MDPYHEEEPVNGKIYNIEVLRMLLRYVLAYKLHLGASVALVAVISAATLAVPYISKIMIDRLIVKQGTVVHVSAPGQKDKIAALLEKKTAHALKLPGGAAFLLQSELSSFSGREMAALTAAGVFSREKYTLIESPDLTPALSAKIDLSAAQGQVIKASESIFLISSAALGRFTVNELIGLRAFDLRRIAGYVLLIMAIFSLQFIATYLQIVSLMKLSQKAMRDLRRDLFAHVISLELSFFDRNPIGRLVNRITNDIEVLNDMFSSVIITLLQDLLILLGITVVMFAIDASLALVVACTFPFLILITILFRLKARAAYRSIRTKIAAMNAFLNENISGIRIVQIFVQEAKQLGRFTRVNDEVYEANMRQLYVYGIFRPLIEFFRWAAIAGVVYAGARLINAGMLSYGGVVMFLSYIGSFFEPLGDLAEKFDIMQSATAAGEKVLLLFRTSAAKEAVFGPAMTTPAKAPSRPGGEIRFDDVWFSYVPGEWVLRGVSFSVKHGRTLAIVGETGSGKTTIASLLSRLYPVQKGVISIGGVNINDFSYPDLRRAIAMVMQDVFLFSRPVAQNIALNNSFDGRRFDEACAISHCDTFIRSLPKGPREIVMERGATFSAGERQLLSFARALYFDPAILILDEATSNIDTETERLIQDAIAHLIRGRTSIIIAHRLSTIRSADAIIVLEKGKIIEEGDHASLLAARGMYHELYNLQFEAI